MLSIIHNLIMLRKLVCSIRRTIWTMETPLKITFEYAIVYV